MTREELKAMIPSSWFEETNEVVSVSFEEFYKNVTENGMKPTLENFTMLVNANIEGYYINSYQNRL